MMRRILAAVTAILAFLLAESPAYGATPTIDSAYLSRGPWTAFEATAFDTDGAAGTYQIFADTDKHCLYIAVSMQDQQVAAGGSDSAIALHLQLSSPKFTTKSFTFSNGAAGAAESYIGFADACNIHMKISANSGGSHTADGTAYLAVALDEKLCGPLTARLDYSCGDRGVCLFTGAAFDYTVPEKATSARSSRTATTQKAKSTRSKAKETTTKFAYTGTVPHTTKSSKKAGTQTATKFAYSGGAAAAKENEEAQQVQSGDIAVQTDDTYAAGIIPTHRSATADILIYIAQSVVLMR